MNVRLFVCHYVCVSASRIFVIDNDDAYNFSYPIITTSRYFNTFERMYTHSYTSNYCKSRKTSGKNSNTIAAYCGTYEITTTTTTTQIEMRVWVEWPIFLMRIYFELFIFFLSQFSLARSLYCIWMRRAILLHIHSSSSHNIKWN